MNKLLQKIKKGSQDLGSFVYVIAFALVSNVVQVVCFYFLRDLNLDAFALINFGVYVYTLMGIITMAFSKWLTMELSKTEPSKRFVFSKQVLRKILLPFIVSILLISIIIYLGYSDAWLIILLCAVAGIFGLFFQFVNSWVNAREWFGLYGLLTVIAPFFRLVSIILFVNDDNVWISFLFVALGTLVSIFIAAGFIYKRDRKLLDSTSKVLSKIDVKTIAFNTILQIAINVFWIADGVILKQLFSKEVYSTYVAYAYIYKFPLFVCLNIIAVVLGKNMFKKGQRKEVSRTFLISLGLIVLSFSALLGVELLSEGFILGLLGYEKLVISGLSYYFGLAWMVQMILFFLFSYLLKLNKNGWKLKVLIITYAVSYIGILYIFNQDIIDLMKSILLQGVLFIIMTLLMKRSD